MIASQLLAADNWQVTAPTTQAADVAALRRCPEDGTLELLYQPEVELGTGAIVAMEGLLRWHRDGATLCPEDFLDLAESCGQSPAIARWVLGTGAAEAARWVPLTGRTVGLWLNVSAGQLRSRDFCGRVAGAVGEAQLPAGTLGLELSEETVQVLGADAAPLLDELHAAGIALALDDFDNWYSTVEIMDVLPLDAVKLGQLHVRGVDLDPFEPAAATVIRAAHDRGIRVVPEGVETPAQARRLTELGCDRPHGWLYASAQRADKARWLLTQGPSWAGTSAGLHRGAS